jgi:aspartyl aminopeptidase
MKEFFDFVKKSTTANLAVKEIKRILTDAGYTELSEREYECFSDGGRHFVIRGTGSVIAFRGKGKGGFMISASHADNPALAVRYQENKPYARLSTEVYGGAIYYSWLDRPLSVAGACSVRTKEGAKICLVDLERAVATIPSVAIHLNRTVNDGVKLNPAKDLLPIVGDFESRASLNEAIAEKLGVKTEDIISTELYLYNADEPRLVGLDGSLILSPRLDDLSSVYAALSGFLSAEESGDSVPVLAVFDNEEVGSATAEGAASSFLHDTLLAISGDEASLRARLLNSLMLSADNAHALHPNHPELSDTAVAPELGRGVAVKYNANKRYATGLVADTALRLIAEKAGVPLQSYRNRADMPGGSTLGAIATTKVSVPCVDIGIPQLAMHSATETVAVRDLEYMTSLHRTLFSSVLTRTPDGITLK